MEDGRPGDRAGRPNLPGFDRALLAPRARYLPDAPAPALRRRGRVGGREQVEIHRPQFRLLAHYRVSARVGLPFGNRFEDTAGRNSRAPQVYRSPRGAPVDRSARNADGPQGRDRSRERKVFRDRNRRCDVPFRGKLAARFPRMHGARARAGRQIFRDNHDGDTRPHRRPGRGGSGRIHRRRRHRGPRDDAVLAGHVPQVLLSVSEPDNRKMPLPLAAVFQAHRRKHRGHRKRTPARMRRRRLSRHRAERRDGHRQAQEGVRPKAHAPGKHRLWTPADARLQGRDLGAGAPMHKRRGSRRRIRAQLYGEYPISDPA